MGLRKIFLAILLLGSGALPLVVTLGWLAPTWVNRSLGDLGEPAMLVSFVVSVVLVGWMFLACARSESLTRREKNRWYGLLLIGGPVTAVAYLWGERSTEEAQS